MDRSLWSLLGWLRNAVDFPLRQAIRWRRPGLRLPAQPKDGLFSGVAVKEAGRLVAAYQLEEWERESERTDFAASLFYLQMLERGLRESGAALPPGRLTALDAGCGDWFYVRALYGLLRCYGADSPREVALDGVEVDGYRMYGGFHSRHDWALAFARGCEGARYLATDLRAYRREVDIAFLLFPFLFGRDALRWGLPARYLRPAELLGHVWGLVRPGGLLLIANLGDGERREQDRLLAEAGLEPIWSGAHLSPLVQYREERHLTVLRRAPIPADSPTIRHQV